MSTGRNKKRKYRQSLSNEENRRVRRMIRYGELPRYFIAKEKDSDKHLERRLVGKRRKLTWRLVSTYAELTK